MEKYLNRPWVVSGPRALTPQATAHLGLAHGRSQRGGHAQGARRTCGVCGHRTAGSGGGTATDDGGGDTVESSWWLEHEGGTGVARGMRRRATMHHSSGSTVRRRVWTVAARFTGGEGPPVVDCDSACTGSCRGSARPRFGARW
jgi:hypothetical protein